MADDRNENARERRRTKGGKRSSTRSDDRRGDRDGAANPASADVERERMLERARRYVRENEERKRRRHGHGRKKRDRGDDDGDTRGGSSGGSDHGGAGSSSGGDDDHRRRRGRTKHGHHRPSREEERGARKSDRHRGGGGGSRRDGDRRRSRSRSRDRDRDGKRGKASRGSSHGRSDRDGDRKHQEKSPKGEKRGRREEDGRRDESRKHSRHDQKRNKEKRKESSTEGAAPKNLYPLGPIANVAPESPLDPEADYFAYNPHLRLFLYRKDGTYFEGLTSDQSRSAFESFVDIYNAGKLEEAYYAKSGLPTPAVDQCKRTKHRWTFKTSATERQSLDLLKEGVRKQTEYDAAAGASRPAAVATEGSRVSGHGNNLAENGGNQRPRKAERDLAAERAANRRLRERVKVAQEELSGGKKDGRERLIEKKKEKAALQHGAAHDREASAAGVELDDKEVFGDGEGESFKRALVRERQFKAKREEKKASRIAELQQKEKDKQADMLKMLGLSGLQPGQKITIAPRKD